MRLNYNIVWFANTCREARKRKRLTQTDVARRVRVSAPYISMIECGYNRVTFPVARRLARVLGREVLDAALSEC